MYAVTLQECNYHTIKRIIRLDVLAMSMMLASYVQCTYTTALRGERRGQEAQDLTPHRPIYFRFGS